MSYWRSFLFLALACLSLVFAAARQQQSPPLTAPPPLYPLQPSSEAAGILEQAIVCCDPARRPWLQATLWQQVNAAPLTFLAEGTFLTGPERRWRLDMRVQTGKSARRCQVVSDGKTLWETDCDCEGEGRWVARVDLQELLGSGIPSPGVDRELRRLCNFPGPDRLLREVRQQVIFTRAEKLSWRERDVFLLTGARAPDSLGPVCPPFLPRQCRLILDARTYWPHRLEWWGPSPGSPGDVCLLELELREAPAPRPVAADGFSFDPGNAEVRDQTPAWRDKLRARVVERRTYPGDY